MKRCRIVDFSEAVRNVACRIFEHFTFEPSKPESGRDALDLCAKSMPDAIMAQPNS
jgi:two-component system chemotaxis response regulator CheY